MLSVYDRSRLASGVCEPHWNYASGPSTAFDVVIMTSIQRSVCHKATHSFCSGCMWLERQQLLLKLLLKRSCCVQFAVKL